MTARLLVIGCGIALGTALLAQDIPPPPPPPPPPPLPAVARDPPVGLGVGRASLSGVVVTEEATPQPVRKATVRLGGVDGNGGRVAITDDAGRFLFAALPAGRYVLTPSREGFIGLAYGAKRPERPGSAISVGDGQQVTGLVARMLRGAVITGTVRDEKGEPVPGQAVTVMRYGFSSQTGERTLQSVRGPFGSSTDDRGTFRVYGLAPGDYLVVAPQGVGVLRGGTDVHRVTAADVSWATQQIDNRGRPGSQTVPPPPSAPNVMYGPVFFPGVPNEASASTITLAAGEERAGVDISLRLVPTSAIAGTVTWADGSVPPNAQVILLAHDRIEGLAFSGFSPAPAVVNGKFTFTGLTPGRYTITARPSNAPNARGGGPALGPEMLTQFALTEVNVDGQDVAVVLRLQPGATITGRLAFDGTSAPPADLSKARVSLSAVIGRSQAAIGVAPATVDATGAFEFAGVAPGRYRLTASVPGSTATSGWQVRSAMAAGRDALDTPLEVGSATVRDVAVTFTDRLADLSGRIQDAKGQPAPEYFVIVFASDKTFWTPQSRWIQAKRPASDGRFTFPNLPPGAYNLAAVTDVEQGEWFDPSFLAQVVPASIKLVIAEGEKKVQDIQVGAN